MWENRRDHWLRSCHADQTTSFVSASKTLTKNKRTNLDTQKIENFFRRVRQTSLLLQIENVYIQQRFRLTTRNRRQNTHLRLIANEELYLQFDDSRALRRLEVQKRIIWRRVFVDFRKISQCCLSAQQHVCLVKEFCRDLSSVNTT